MATRLVEATGLGTFTSLLPQWERSLRAANKSPRTVQSYLESAGQLQVFLAESFGVTEVALVSREHLETWMVELLARWKPSTASVRYRSVQQLFRWLQEEGEVSTSPMAKMRPPAVPEVPVPVVSDDDLRRLLKACDGKTYEDRRDTAIIRVFCEPGGCRLSELAGLRLDDVDTEQSSIMVLGKGRRPRIVPYGFKTAQAIDRYLRLRARHPRAALQGFWLTSKGAMSPGGIQQMLKRRCLQAGIDKVHPHQLRHTAAHVWMANGGNETDAKRLFGWRSQQMVARYGASAADGRARDAHRRLALGDRL